MSKQTIKDYQLVDHGIDHAQYFRGCGTAFTPFNWVTTGCGSNFAEALEDALEQIAMDGFDAERLEAEMLAEYREEIDPSIDPSVNGEWPIVPNTDRYHEENEESEMYYYVSIRWNADNAEVKI